MASPGYCLARTARASIQQACAGAELAAFIRNQHEAWPFRVYATEMEAKHRAAEHPARPL